MLFALVARDTLFATRQFLYIVTRPMCLLSSIKNDLHAVLTVTITLTLSPRRAEPPKKKKKTDPKQEQLRQHRYLKRLKKLQYKMGKAELKPVEEMRVDRALLDESRFVLVCTYKYSVHIMSVHKKTFLREGLMGGLDTISMSNNISNTKRIPIF